MTQTIVIALIVNLPAIITALASGWVAIRARGRANDAHDIATEALNGHDTAPEV